MDKPRVRVDQKTGDYDAYKVLVNGWWADFRVKPGSDFFGALDRTLNALKPRIVDGVWYVG